MMRDRIAKAIHGHGTCHNMYGVPCDGCRDKADAVLEAIWDNAPWIEVVQGQATEYDEHGPIQPYNRLAKGDGSIEQGPQTTLPLGTYRLIREDTDE